MPIHIMSATHWLDVDAKTVANLSGAMELDVMEKDLSHHFTEFS